MASTGPPQHHRVNDQGLAGLRLPPRHHRPVPASNRALNPSLTLSTRGPNESHKSFSAFSPPAIAATPPSHLQLLPSSRLSSFIFSESPAFADSSFLALNPSLTLSTSGPNKSHEPLSAFSAFLPLATAANPPPRLLASSRCLQLATPTADNEYEEWRFID
nr:hypothetical protein Itr_chr13CG09020 [Ipomoea trifida]